MSLASPGWAVTVTIGSNTGNSGSATDVKIKSVASTTNYEGGSDLEVHYFAVGDHGATLLKFDLSSIAPTVVVNSVTLHLYQESVFAAGDQAGIHRLLRNWTANQATWNVYTTGNSWTTAGALSDGNDRVGAASATVVLPGYTLGDTTVSSAGMATDVQNWINGITPNYGWLIADDVPFDPDNGNYSVFTSSDGTNTQRPYLVIDYTTVAAGVHRRQVVGVQ